ncbi:unnamed protein product [Rhodiola kirilowii]
MPPPPSTIRSASPSQPSGKGEVSDLKAQLRQLAVAEHQEQMIQSVISLKKSFLT